MPLSNPLRWALAAALVLTPVVAVDDVAAQPSPGEIERARTLYSQGLTQEAAGDWAGALGTFEKVARIRMTPQVRYHIARCKEQLGRLNEALGGYRLAEHEARNAEKTNDEVLTAIVSARKKLEVRVPSLIIERGEGTTSARITLDGVKLGHKQIGKKVNVDPGPHTIEVELVDGRRFQKTVHLDEGGTEQVILDVPPDLQAAPSEVGKRSEPDDAEPVQGDDSGVTSDRADDGGPGAVPWVIGGIGVASLVASGYFYTQRNAADEDLEDSCISNVCPENLQSKEDDGKQAATMTGIFLGVGLVGVATSIIWLVAGGSSDSPRADSAGLNVDVGVSPQRDARVGLRGRF